MIAAVASAFHSESVSVFFGIESILMNINAAIYSLLKNKSES
jgi:hypothetical protein